MLILEEYVEAERIWWEFLERLVDEIHASFIENDEQWAGLATG